MTKRLFVICLICFCVSAYGFGDSDPFVSINWLLTDSVAFTGLGFEFFFLPLGLGATFTASAIEGQDRLFLLWEPGAYVHFYLGNLAETFLITLGATYVDSTANIGLSRGLPSLLRNGLVNINVGMGYQTLFGRQDNFRLAVEFGPRYVIWTQAPPWERSGWLFAHFTLMIGPVF